MASFSPTDAAFEGFRLTREHPRSVLAWALCSLLFSYAADVVAWLTLGPQSRAMVADFMGSASDAAAFWPAARKIAPFFLIGLPLNLLFQAIFTCAVYRAILRPAESARGYLRLGPDELRMVALGLIFDLIWGGALFGVGLVGAMSAATASRAPAPLVLLGDLATLAAVGWAIVLLLRLSLAGPMTFAEKRIIVFGSWGMTRGRGWRLLWAYFLALVLGLFVVSLMLLLVFAAAGIAFQLSGIRLDGAGALPSSPVVAGFAVVAEAAQAVMLTCFYVVWKAPAAQAYKELVKADVAGTFA